MRYLLTTIMLLMVSAFTFANDTIQISTPLENIAVEIDNEGNCNFYAKVASGFYKTDKESYLKFRDCMKQGKIIYPYAIVDDKNRVLRIIYRS